MFKKLRMKFIATAVLLITVVIILICTSIYLVTKNNSEYMIFTQMNDVLNSVKGAQPFDKNNKGMPGIIVFYDVKNSRLSYSSREDIEGDTLVTIVDKIVKEGKDKGFINSNEYNYAYVCRNNPGGVEMVLQDSSFYEHTMNRLVISCIVIGTVSGIFLSLLSIFVVKKTIKPVEEAYNSQKRFIADASHELKTPLAVVKTNIDLLKVNEEDTIKNQIKWVDYISFQTDRMSKLVNNLLYLAKADNNECLGVVSEFNISDVIMSQLLSFEAVIYERSLSFDLDIDSNIRFKGDKEGINQLVGILMDNAIKHSFKDTKIKVSLKEKKQKLYLHVTNVGEIIKEEDREKIFERFYRVDKSRSREQGGYGLGLSIAKSIVDKHKGKIKVESKDNKTTFKIEFTNVQ